MNTELAIGFDEILFQLSKGNTVDGIKANRIWMGYRQVKEWQTQFGYEFHIYPNDHLIDKKPHFHLVKKSEGIECRLFFDGRVYDCKGSKTPDRKVQDALDYFLSLDRNQMRLTELWNTINPQCRI